MDIQHIVNKTLPLFDVHNDAEYIEVEMRLGKFNGQFFDTNVGKEVFDKVLLALQGYKGWEDIRSFTCDVFYHDAAGVRLSVDDTTGEQTMVQKQSLVREDFNYPSTPLDLRFSISKEMPISGEYEMDRKRTKRRQSFIRKNLSIDMTISSGDVVDKDAEDPNHYQIELEIVNPANVSCQEEYFNILWKVNDILKIIS
jgi:hypothetical protein|tara:strand:+ start:29585 stop:30178 length:594 start_codon:yes stop_codon:yes gene_type:complete